MISSFFLSHFSIFFDIMTSDFNSKFDVKLGKEEREGKKARYFVKSKKDASKELNTNFKVKNYGAVHKRFFL